MRKTFWIRALVLALAIVLVLALPSCGVVGGDESDTEETEEDTEVDYYPDIDKQDYDADFNIYMLPMCNYPEYYVLEESNGSIMDEAVYTRQERIKRYLGVDMVRKVDSSLDLAWQTYISVLTTAVMNKDGTLDAMLSHYNGGIPALLTENYLKDFNDLDIIDLDAEYWNSEFMDSIELKGHRYLGFGDCNILYVFLVSFNKDMYDQYADAAAFGGKSFYDLVRDYEWTFDKMISIANLVYVDSTGDGKSKDDTFGYSAAAWEPYRAFIQSSGMRIMEQDESGSYKVVLHEEKNANKVDRLINILSDLSKSDCAWVEYSWNDTGLSLTTGRVLMSIYDTMHIPEYLSYEIDFGVLPLPMYDTAQKETGGYCTLQYGGYICVPTWVKDEKMVCETLEMYNFYSESVKITFYEKLLGKQVADMPDDAAMFDIIWNSVATDVGFTYQTTSTIDGSGGNSVGGCMVRLTNPDSTDGGLSSWFARFVGAQQTGFDNFYKSIK